ncbi:GLX2-2 [Symbiodinium natans]|uniref:hydroxyacylglutathione hydrolase n=1 Tax=Symbiodinium natans TaxID=878477 RepID=A0A812JCU5_9DINO|nr:GLX2-2 [Symbiodinium natans]
MSCAVWQAAFVVLASPWYRCRACFRRATPVRYLLIDDAKKVAACVDPAEAHLVLAKAKEEGVQLVAVLTTHHHYDHAGGNEEMTKQVPGIRVYGGRLDNVAACTDPLEHSDKFNIGSIEVCALHTPGHTRGSICYHCYDATDNQGLVFTGDTLFVAGCGRMFESTPEDFHNSLVNVLGALPPETQVYVGHEYTVKNLQFAVAVDAANKDLEQMLGWAQEQKAHTAVSGERVRRK